MSKRQELLDIFARRSTLARPPVSVRLDLWHADAVARGALPPDVAGCSVTEVEDYLGFTRAARFRLQPRLAFRHAQHHVIRTEGHCREEYRFPERTLVRESCRTEAMCRQGIQAHITRYPLTGAADYDLLRRHLDAASVVCEVSGFAALEAATADRGLPLLIAGVCPAHLVMLELAGYEGFYYHLADFPEQVAALIAALETLYRRDLWPAIGATAARLVLHGAHFSSQMTPRPVFTRFFAPYFTEFAALMHRQGRHLLCHADAEMGDLLDLVLACGFDGVDCLATAPLVPQPLADFFRAWQGRLVCWGGLPSIIFDATYPLADYRAYVAGLVELTRGRQDFIFGASDHVMPGAEWERLRWLAERTSQ